LRAYLSNGVVWYDNLMPRAQNGGWFFFAHELILAGRNQARKL
jgi:hypothetical protein